MKLKFFLLIYANLYAIRIVPKDIRVASSFTPFGIIFFFQDTGKKIAMKSVEAGANKTSTSKAVEALQPEIQLCQTLKHESIVNYYGTLNKNKIVFIN